MGKGWGSTGGRGDNVLFADGVFTPHALADPRATDVLHAATDRAVDEVRTGDLLHAIVSSGEMGIRSALTIALADGSQPQDVLNGIAIYRPADRARADFDGRRERFTEEALRALDAFAADLAAHPAREVGLELLAANVLEHLDEQDRKYLPILDARRAARALREQVRLAVEPPPSLIDEMTGRLRSEEFSEASWAALELAADRAAELGYDRILPPHCLLGLLAETEGVAEHLIRRQLSPTVGLVNVVRSVTDAFRLSDRRRDAAAPALNRDTIGDALLDLLRRAQRTAVVWEAERIDSRHLLRAMLETMPAPLSDVLRSPPLSLDLDRLREHLDQALRDARTASPHEVPFRLPAGLPPSADLTWQARNDEMAPALHLDRYFDPLIRALHRTADNHVLITGLPGVGTTTLLRELARRAVGQIPFLRRKRFLYVDCRDVAAADSGDKLTKIIAHVADRTDVITCIDGLGSLLRGEPGGDQRLILRSALKERRIHLIGVLSAHDFDDLITPDHTLVALTTRIDMAEPGQAEAREMVAQAAEALTAEFGVAIDDSAVERSVVLTGDYILSERLPAKAIRVLRRACEDLHYRRTQTGSEQAAVTTDDIVSVVAEISGVPASQISGVGGERVDFEQSLSEAVVGQPDAVRLVSAELRRIKMGLTGSGRRPASVLLLAGLTGVGKTELAKTVARFYSASKRLQTYPMENFTESHSVSGILGSPPGYVGHSRADASSTTSTPTRTACSCSTRRRRRTPTCGGRS
jgi:ATP-dependent Clp protease ATP-binding subunit ClpC